MKSAYEIINDLVKKYGDYTIGDFHSTLWEIMVKDAYKDIQSAFIILKRTGYGEIDKPLRHNVGIVRLNQSGYVPAKFSLKMNVAVETQWEMFDELNREVFGVTSKRAMEIEVSTMFIKKHSGHNAYDRENKAW